ncbi:MAG: hypothetical protein ABSH14_13720 [Verrucomicrobiia bacterium]
MKIAAAIAFLLSLVAVSRAAPTASWTPPPERFTADEWTNRSPTWAATESDRGHTIVWFYKEMKQEEALPVLLRALDYGETWLQTKAVQQLEKLTIPFPKDFEGKLVPFYDSIQLDKFPADIKAFSAIENDRAALKFELAILLFKINPERGRATIKTLAKAAPQEQFRSVAKQMILELTKTNSIPAK